MRIFRHKNIHTALHKSYDSWGNIERWFRSHKYGVPSKEAWASLHVHTTKLLEEFRTLIEDFQKIERLLGSTHHGTALDTVWYLESL